MPSARGGPLHAVNLICLRGRAAAERFPAPTIRSPSQWPGVVIGGRAVISRNWPSGAKWTQSNDWTNRSQTSGAAYTARSFVAAFGAPLEAGTYVVGVFNADSVNATSYSITSRTIGRRETHRTAAGRPSAHRRVADSSLDRKSSAEFARMAG